MRICFIPSKKRILARVSKCSKTGLRGKRKDGATPTLGQHAHMMHAVNVARNPGVL